MATRRAIANGNWSATGTWNGGVVPTNGDTVYANGFNVTLDVDVTIGGANNPTVNTGSLVSGQWYEVVNVGGQTWTTLGAASNTVGTIFQSTGTGTAGNLGTARALATLTTATNTAAGATTGGGVFTMSTVRAMTCDLRPGATICLDVSATTGTLSLTGLKIVGGSAVALRNNNAATINATGCSFFGSAASAFQNTSTGVVVIDNSTLSAGGSGQSGHGAVNSGAGSITVSLSTLSGGGSASNTSAVQNASATGTVTITSSALTGGNGNASYAFQNVTTGSAIINSSTITAASLSFAAVNSSTGSFFCTGCTFTASAFANAVFIVSTAADVRLSGDFLDHWSGWKAVSGSKWRLGTTPTAARTRYALAGTTDSYVEMFTADNTGFGLPAANHVRSGISYGGGAVSGTCAVPSAGSVAFGVPVDAGYGTAVLTPEAVWGAGTRTLTAGAGISASDVWSHASRTITGGTVDTLTNAPSVPSASAIASQVRTELSVELGRVDAAISTRATPANIPTSDITAIKAKTDALNTTRLGQCTTTEILGNLLAQANS